MILIHSLLWDEKACGETISSRLTSSVICCPKRACGKITRWAIRAMVDEVLSQFSRRFDTMSARVGRTSIAPEKLLRAQLLLEAMNHNLLFRWFVGLNADDEVWDATTVNFRGERP
jgi:Transposase domain (DUF772)